MAEPKASHVSTAQGELGYSRQTYALRLGLLYPRHHSQGLNGAIPQDSHRKVKAQRVPGASLCIVGGSREGNLGPPLCVGGRDNNLGPYCVLGGRDSNLGPYCVLKGMEGNLGPHCML